MRRGWPLVVTIIFGYLCDWRGMFKSFPHRIAHAESESWESYEYDERKNRRRSKLLGEVAECHRKVIQTGSLPLLRRKAARSKSRGA